MTYIDYIKLALSEYKKHLSFFKSDESVYAANVLQKLIDDGDENKLRAYVSYYMGDQQSMSRDRDEIEKIAGKQIKKDGNLFKDLSDQIINYKNELKKNVPNPTPEERKKTIARFTSGSFVSSIQSSKQSFFTAMTDDAPIQDMKQIPKIYNQGLDRYLTPDEILHAVTLLRNARLTINFNADNFLSAMLKQKQNHNKPTIQNRFERGNTKDTARLLNEQIIFAFKESIDKATPQDNNYVQPLSEAYDYQSSQYDPSLRPKYGTLDILKGDNASAKGYGRSFFELRDHMKSMCTFTPGDTGHLNFHKGQYSTIFDFSFILSNANKQLITNLLSDPDIKPSSDYGVLISSYVEAQIHAEIDILRDVKCIHLDADELKRTKTDENELMNFAQMIKENHDVDVKIIGRDEVLAPTKQFKM